MTLELDMYILIQVNGNEYKAKALCVNNLKMTSKSSN